MNSCGTQTLFSDHHQLATVIFGVSCVLWVDAETLIDVEGHRIVAPMRYSLREVDKQHLSVLHDEMVQLEWGVLRDAKSVDFAYTVHRETTEGK